MKSGGTPGAIILISTMQAVVPFDGIDRLCRAKGGPDPCRPDPCERVPREDRNPRERDLPGRQSGWHG